MGEERRRSPRIPQSFQVHCRARGGLSESWRPLRTLDISATGLRVRSEEPFELLSTMDVRLPMPDLGELLEVRGRVAWTKTLPSGMAEMGIEFVDVSPEQRAQLDEMIRSFTTRP